MNKGKNVASVVVTYNRLEFLKEIIESLRTQTYKIDEIFIINNSSSDGTIDWLNCQNDLTIITQPNYGSSGGQYTGMKAAFEKGHEWIWVMDDDVVPVNNCLELLLEDDDPKIIRAPLRYQVDGSVFFNDAVCYNLTNPFRGFWEGVLSDEMLKDKYISVVGLTFEGPLIHRSVIEKIGLPDKKFFLFADDTEYFIRANLNGIRNFVCRDARLNRKLKVQGVKEIPAWKWFYIVRNLVAINVTHGSFAVRIIRPFFILIKSAFKCRSLRSLLMVLKGFSKGYFYKSVND